MPDPAAAGAVALAPAREVGGSAGAGPGGAGVAARRRARRDGGSRSGVVSLGAVRPLSWPPHASAFPVSTPQLRYAAAVSGAGGPLRARTRRRGPSRRLFFDQQSSDLREERRRVAPAAVAAHGLCVRAAPQRRSRPHPAPARPPRPPSLPRAPPGRPPAPLHPLSG